jgi:quercetin dioxygenase-like cupin family protein
MVEGPSGPFLLNIDILGNHAMEVFTILKDQQEGSTEDSTITTITCVSNVYIRQITYPKKGCKNVAHLHQHDHTTLLAAGSVDVNVNGQVTHYTAPSMIYIEKDHIHNFTSTEDNTVCYCIHALRDGDGVNDIIDPATIPKGVNPWWQSKRPLIKSTPYKKSNN